MTIHPLGENGFLVEINSDYIQAIYRERDEALTRNRQLEEENNQLRMLVNDLQSGLQDCWDNEYSLEELQALRMRVKEVLLGRKSS